VEYLINKQKFIIFAASKR